MASSASSVAALACVLCLGLALTQAAREMPKMELVSGDAIAAADGGMLVSFGKAFLMILATELGDETFIIAAIMSMQHPRLVVYAGAMTALVFMTIISTILGFILPNLISRQATQHAASLLYTIFGIRLLWIAWRSSPQESNQEEVEEVQEKLKHAEQEQQRSRFSKVVMQFVTPALLEALVLTFIAEWGDRSQIATISLAATYNPFGVTLGAIVGHALCTGTAVLGGQLMAMRISQRTVACVGGLLFLVFAAHNLFMSWKQ